MGLWWRQPKQVVTAHSNQGGLFTAHEWQAFPSNHNLGSSTSRRGNFHDNAVTESFFQSLKRERIRRQVYAARNDARADVFDYVKMFYNTRRQHGSTAARHRRRHFAGRFRATSHTTVHECLGNPGRSANGSPSGSGQLQPICTRCRQILGGSHGSKAAEQDAAIGPSDSRPNRKRDIGIRQGRTRLVRCRCPIQRDWSYHCLAGDFDRKSGIAAFSADGFGSPRGLTERGASVARHTDSKDASIAR